MTQNLARASTRASVPALYDPSQDNSLPQVSLRAVAGAVDASCEALGGLTGAITSCKTPDLPRDPRIDPKPGDEIVRWVETAKGGCIIRLVTRAHGGFVFYTQDNGYTAKPKYEDIRDWRRWAAKAEVINRSTESGGNGTCLKTI